MKNRLDILVASLIAGSCLMFATAPATAQPGASISFQTFYDELSPYGRWIDDPEYGYVWLPDAEADFHPYASRGRWVVTTYGNTWVSDYPWGWATFHYGRWKYDDYYGWMWVPGYEWGPAWVSWRSGGDYYGWAPLGPGLSVNVSINLPAFHWIFVPRRYITSYQIHHYYVPRTRVINIYRHTTVINNYYVYRNYRYVCGPRYSEIERFTGRKVHVHRVHHSARPGRVSVHNGAVEIYRPSVVKATGGSSRPRPSTVYTASRTGIRPTSSGASSERARPTAGSERSSRPSAVRPSTGESRPRVSSESSRPKSSARPQSGSRPEVSARPQGSTRASGVRPSQSRESQPRVSPRRPQSSARPQASPRPEVRRSAPQARPEASRPQHSRPAARPSQSRESQPKASPPSRSSRPQAAPRPQARESSVLKVSSKSGSRPSGARPSQSSRPRGRGN